MSGFQNERYSVDQLVRYITEKILKLPDDTIV